MNNIEITYTAIVKTDVSGEISFSKTLPVNEIDPELWQNTSPITKSLGPDDCDGGQNAVFAAQDIMRSMSADLYRAVKVLSSEQERNPEHAIGVYLGDERLGATPIGQQSMIGYRIDPDIIVGIKVTVDPDDIRDLDANPCQISGI